MSEARSLLDYQREVSSLSRIPEPPTEDVEEPRWGLEAAALYRAGWDYMVAGPKRLRIWCEDAGDPWKMWVSEEVAYMRLQRKRDGGK